MKDFIKKHPALEESCEIIVALLSGSFALLAVLWVWIKELTGQKKGRGDSGHDRLDKDGR